MLARAPGSRFPPAARRPTSTAASRSPSGSAGRWRSSSAARRSSHKTRSGALALGIASAGGARRRARAAGRAARAPAGRDLLVERMAPPGLELIVAARADAVVPALVVGLGGAWAEALDDVAIVPLPAEPERVEAALRSLRGAALLSGAAAAVAAWPTSRRSPPGSASCCSSAASRCSSSTRSRSRRRRRGRARRRRPTPAAASIRRSVDLVVNCT